MKQSFFERITGTINLKKSVRDEELPEEELFLNEDTQSADENSDGELSVDAHETDEAIIVHAMIAGVAHEDLSISVTRELLTIKGNREMPSNIPDENYFYRELYWGSFSRSIILPQEVETEEVTATERRGLLTITLPKIDKAKIQKVKIKSL